MFKFLYRAAPAVQQKAGVSFRTICPVSVGVSNNLRTASSKLASFTNSAEVFRRPLTSSLQALFLSVASEDTCGSRRQPGCYPRIVDKSYGSKNRLHRRLSLEAKAISGFLALNNQPVAVFLGPNLGRLEQVAEGRVGVAVCDGVELILAEAQLAPIVPDRIAGTQVSAGGKAAVKRLTCDRA